MLNTTYTQTENQQNPTEGVPPSDSLRGSANSRGEKSLVLKLEPSRIVLDGEWTRVFDDDALGVAVYMRPRADRGVTVKVFQGKRTKPDFFESFLTEDSARQRWTGWYNRIVKWHEKKAERRAERKAEMAKPHDLNVGDVLSASWGYDQTNCNFFEVIRVIGKRTVEIREIGKEKDYAGSMHGVCVPRKGHYIDEPMIKRVNVDGSVKIFTWGVHAYKETPREVGGIQVFEPHSFSEWA
jgi:hypothetical protein